MISDFFRISLNNLKRRRLRSWLTMLGIFIGIAAVVSLISLGQGLQTAITGQFSTLSTDKLTIQNSGTGFGPPGSTVVEKLNDHDVNVIEKARGVEIVIPRYVRVVKVEYNDGASFNYIADVPEDKEIMDIVYGAGDLVAKEGRLLKAGDGGKVMLGSNLAKKSTFDKKVNIGDNIIVQGKTYEVVGILKKASTFTINDALMLTTKDLKNLLDIDDEIDMIIAQVDEGEVPTEVAERIRKAMRRDRDLDEGEEDFSVQTPLQSISAVNDVLTLPIKLLIAFASSSFLVFPVVRYSSTIFNFFLSLILLFKVFTTLSAIHKDMSASYL